jgi:hypothetical protein
MKGDLEFELQIAWLSMSNRGWWHERLADDRPKPGRRYVFLMRLGIEESDIATTRPDGSGRGFAAGF